MDRHSSAQYGNRPDKHSRRLPPINAVVASYPFLRIPKGYKKGRPCFFPERVAFPVSQAGRHPQLHFRGLLKLHSRYGLQSCSSTFRGLCHEASATFPYHCSLATRLTDNYLCGSFPHRCSAPLGRTEKSGLGRGFLHEPPAL